MWSGAALEEDAAVRVFACTLAPSLLSLKSLTHSYVLSHLRQPGGGIIMPQLNPMASKGAPYGLTPQMIKGRGVWEGNQLCELGRSFKPRGPQLFTYKTERLTPKLNDIGIPHLKALKQRE